MKTIDLYEKTNQINQVNDIHKWKNVGKFYIWNWTLSCTYSLLLFDFFGYFSFLVEFNDFHRLYFVNIFYNGNNSHYDLIKINPNKIKVLIDDSANGAIYAVI